MTSQEYRTFDPISNARDRTGQALMEAATSEVLPFSRSLDPDEDENFSRPRTASYTFVKVGQCGFHHLRFGVGAFGFTVLSRNRILLINTESRIYVANLRLNRILPIMMINCPAEVLLTVLDSTTTYIRLAALLKGRRIMSLKLCFDDMEDAQDFAASILRGEVESDVSVVPALAARDAYTNLPIYTSFTPTVHNICTKEDPPRCIAVCARSNTVVFGNQKNIEYVDPERPNLRRSPMRLFPRTRCDNLSVRFDRRASGLDAVVVTSASCNLNQRLGAGKLPADNPIRASAQKSCEHWGGVIPIEKSNYLLMTNYHTDTLSFGLVAAGNNAPPLVDERLKFIPPRCCPVGRSRAPSTYAGLCSNGKDVQIAVGYSDTIAFFNLTERILSTLEFSPVTPNVPARGPPICVHGIPVGRMRGLTELGVLADRATFVWAFSEHGEGRVWQLQSSYPLLSMQSVQEWPVDVYSGTNSVRESSGYQDFNQFATKPSALPADSGYTSTTGSNHGQQTAAFTKNVQNEDDDDDADKMDLDEPCGIPIEAAVCAEVEMQDVPIKTKQIPIKYANRISPLPSRTIINPKKSTRFMFKSRQSSRSSSYEWSSLGVVCTETETSSQADLVVSGPAGVTFTVQSHERVTSYHYKH